MLSDPLSLLLLEHLQPGPLGLQETAFRKGMRISARDCLAQAAGGEGCPRSEPGPMEGEASLGAPHPSPCRPAAHPRKVGVTLTAGDARGEPRGAAGPGLPVGLGGVHRVGRRSATHWSPESFRLWVLFYNHTILKTFSQLQF